MTFQTNSNESSSDDFSTLKISKHFGRLGNNMNYIIGAIQTIDHNISKLDIGKSQIETTSCQNFLKMKLLTSM